MEEKNIVWLIGAGPMAVDYAKVLKELKVDFITITKGEKKAQEFKDLIGAEIITGGVSEYLKKCNYLPKFVINSVGIDKLSEVTQILLNAGIKNMLLEKPGVAYADEIYPLDKLAKEKNANVLLAYNRRFYQSTLAAKKIIEEDGGVTSFNFEFTEWSHAIADILHLKTEAEMQNWFLGNSSHVIDMAFYLGGMPEELSCFHTGSNELNWHKKSVNYNYKKTEKSSGTTSVFLLWHTARADALTKHST